MGLGDEAIFFMNRAGPDDVNVLTPEIAAELGIDVTYTGRAVAKANPQLPGEGPVVHGAKFYVCRLDPRAPYASGDACTEATAENVEIPREARRGNQFRWFI
jgi:hypothetical protein